MIAGIEIAVKNRRGVELAMGWLNQANEWWWREAKHPPPPLYASGVRYERDGVGRERWKTIPVALAELSGDCKVLASWRMTELRETGEDPAARTEVVEVFPRVWHIVVRRGFGLIEDPSRILGGEGAY